MKKRCLLALALVLVAITVVAAFLATQTQPSTAPSTDKKLYVGVTYCGDDAEEAKQLIEQVKNYTNMFIVASGPLQEKPQAITEICDYAISNDLYVMVNFGSYYAKRAVVAEFLAENQNRWGTHFLGIYYGDEAAGKMLDTQVDLGGRGLDYFVTKTAQHEIRIQSGNTQTTFYPSGKILAVSDSPAGELQHLSNMTTYYSNGTIDYASINGAHTHQLTYQPDGTVTQTNIDGTTSYVTDQGNITQFTPYSELWSSRPLQTNDEVAEKFVATQRVNLDWFHSNTTAKAFTSDYALYWYDYLCGYDVVLAQFGWNHTTAQDIALVRGAANLQDKSWGAILTWKANTAPYLPSGEEMYEQLMMAYEGGAQYVAVFNYSPNEDGVGLLQEEHFEALQRFWADAAHTEHRKEAAPEAVLVLPQNYGWGIRSRNDTIWGLWEPDDKAPQVWASVQQALATKGLNVDIVYSDPAYPVGSAYPQVYSWDNMD
jgi:hypothetical protein